MAQTIGVGAKLEYESGSSWVEVEFVKSVSFPTMAITSIDTTHLGIEDYAKTYMPGMIDSGTVGFTCSYQDSVYEALNGLLREVIGWRVSDPNTAGPLVVTCDGFLTKVEVSYTPDEEAMITAELKMTGLPEVTGGA